MKVLFLCSGNNDVVSSFLVEQADSLKEIGVDIDFFLIKGKGAFGYLNNLAPLKKAIYEGKYDLLHAHYGLSGMLGALQKILPLVITFHGCDLNKSFNRLISGIAIRKAAHSIFVSRRLYEKVNLKKNYSIIPCGIDLEKMFTMDKLEARKKLNLNPNAKYVLFSSSFNRIEKNYMLARKALDYIDNAELIELKNYTREEVNLLLNACDLLLVTSIREAGPLIVKEAMACNCPVVSTDVGDVIELLSSMEGCYLTTYHPAEIAEKIELVFNRNSRTNGRSKVQDLSLKSIALKIKEVYNKL